MVRGNKRIQQIAVGIFAVLSLMVASVAACTCSHHEPVAQTKTSCHETQHHDSVSPNVGLPVIEETCFCVPPANDRSVKSESFKLKKLGASPIATTPPEQASYQTAVVRVYFPAEKLLRGRILYPSVLSRGPPLL